MAQTFDDYRWLASAEAEPLLRDLQQQLGNGGQVDVRLAASLRKNHSASRTHLLLEQVELRSRARAKFSQPERMLFTRKGLEQATDEAIAAAKAERLASFASDKSVIDLCCGIGGDLLAWASYAAACGYDTDAVSTFFANRNLESFGRSHSRAIAERAETQTVGGSTVWHIDPDRRATGERTIQLADYEPGPAFLLELLQANPHGAVKVAPAADFDEARWPSAEREWLGSRGECRQQMLWFGQWIRQPGMHVATVVAGEMQESFAGRPNLPLTMAEKIERFLYEPDATVLAAHLAGAYAEQHSLATITAGGGYLTGGEIENSSLHAAFRVREVLPFDLKKLKAYCRKHQLGQLEIKKRGVEIEPFRLRREILATGDHAAVIFVSPFAGGVKAIVADRL